METIIDFIKRNYIYINITLLLLTIYIILFPIIEIPIKSVLKDFNECTYLRVTGKPCPICGGTTYIRNLPQIFEDVTYLFNPFGIIIIGIVVENIFRIYNIITRKKEKTKRYIKIDTCVHIIAFICFSIYEIVFIIIN